MVDYSKWNKIEVSDDEEDTHPNIDTPSLFRWRHQARVDRMAALEEKTRISEFKKNECLKKIADAQQDIDKFKKYNPDSEIPDQLKSNFDELDREMKIILEEEIALNKEKKSQPLNVDTLCKEKFSKSIINPVSEIPSGKKTDDEIAAQLQKFMEEHKKEAKHYGMLSKYQDSIEYLTEHPYLASEEAASYLCLWCIDLAVEEKNLLMERVAKQTVCLQFLLEVAASQKAHPRELIKIFFQRITSMDGQYKQSFDAELVAFKTRVHARAKARLEEAKASIEEEERQKRLGPGGLDPVEVMESLPSELKECFEKQDIELLKTIMTSMEPSLAEYHLKRCIDSGLWVPNANDNAQDQETPYDHVENLETGEPPSK